MTIVYLDLSVQFPTEPGPNSPYGPCGRTVTPNLTNTELGNCVKVEVVVMGSLSQIVHMVRVDVKQLDTERELYKYRAQELCEIRGNLLGPLSLTVLNNYGLCRRKTTLNLNFTNTQLSRCIKVDVVVPVLDSLSQIVLMVRVGLKQH